MASGANSFHTCNKTERKKMYIISEDEKNRSEKVKIMSQSFC